MAHLLQPSQFFFFFYCPWTQHTHIHSWPSANSLPSGTKEIGMKAHASQTVISPVRCWKGHAHCLVWGRPSRWVYISSPGHPFTFLTLICPDLLWIHLYFLQVLHLGIMCFVSLSPISFICSKCSSLISPSSKCLGWMSPCSHSPGYSWVYCFLLCPFPGWRIPASMACLPSAALDCSVSVPSSLSVSTVLQRFRD